ncbi:MAG: hypothetical protein JRH08_15820 [Deltaproteobacteria bacterium]|nr:hypothetical protein [Deltaproteobacteria bacterium]MBW1929953.1 hypothetical protein [Deltaproteobacteria bacterium]MBW2027035.1 hypothetical protein [Deltaproteobacteria bacterium]MBW2127097.1 hypothetical protein [Deltaproteobacteria bacterium]
MKSSIKQKAIKSSLGLLAAILLFFFSGLRIPVLDSTTDTYFREAITKAGIAYATCRIINASISTLKDSSLQLEPAGIGISLAVGQALDPIDDMTERTSDVLVTAITSLGVQKLAYEIGVSLAPSMISICLFIIAILIWFKNDKLISFQRTITKFLILILIARFCLPISSIASKSIYKHYFADQISNTMKELELGSAELDKLKEFSLPNVDGVLETIKNSASFLKQKSIEFKNAIVTTVSNMGNIIDSLIKLTFLYVGAFLIQVIILPLLSFWFLLKIANSFFNTNIPVISHYSKPPKNENTQQSASMKGDSTALQSRQ